MSFEFRLPDIGEGVVEGEVVKWHVKPGDVVREDQPMVEVMTDKATVEIPSPKAGTVREIRAPAGQVAKVGQVMVVIDTEADSRQPTADSKGAKEERQFESKLPKSESPSVSAAAGGAVAQVAANGSARDKVLATPATR